MVVNNIAVIVVAVRGVIDLDGSLSLGRSSSWRISNRESCV